jgi:hypothetical protein
MSDPGVGHESNMSGKTYWNPATDPDKFGGLQNSE